MRASAPAREGRAYSKGLARLSSATGPVYAQFGFADTISGENFVRQLALAFLFALVPVSASAYDGTWYAADY